MNTTSTINDWIAIQPQDDVIIALRNYAKGEQITLPDGVSFNLLDDVPKGHKIAVHTLAPGDDVMKYGFSIGIAKEQIRQGSWIHSHNLKTGLHGLLEYEYQPGVQIQTDMPPEHLRSFDGYLRPNGEAGIRNEIWIVNTVGCINKVCEALARMGQSQFGSRVDGVFHFPHPFGCSQLGDDLKYTQQLLASLVEHPNAGGVLVIGLGCENNQVDEFRECIAPEYRGKVRFLKAQETDDELEEGLRLMEELVEIAEHEQRQPLPLSKLKIGLKCGGSDGLSGITANPLVGAVADMLVAAGGRLF